MPRIISRQEGGIVPLGHTSARVMRPSMWLLLHHTGATGWPKPGWSDAQHMAGLQGVSNAVGKTWEYNYVITHPGGWIWEQAGENQAAHCLNANQFSYGVQINQADSAGMPPQVIVDSFRWLRAHLVEVGALHPQHQVVPHYGLRSTSCSSTDLAQPPQGRRPNSPSGEGSLGSVHPAFLVPWSATPPAPTPGPPPTPIAGDNDDMYSLWYDPTPARDSDGHMPGAVYQVADDGQSKRWVSSTAELTWLQAVLTLHGKNNNAGNAGSSPDITNWIARTPNAAGSQRPNGSIAPAP